MAKCKIPMCDREGGRVSGICSRCSSSRYYWGKQSPARVLERRKKLAFYSSRIKFWFSEKGRMK